MYENCRSQRVAKLSRQVWQDPFRLAAANKPKPYLVHNPITTGVHHVRFVPYEDVLGMGLRDGVATMLVPGAGEQNYDTFVADPFEDRNVRREREVVQLLEKL